MNDDPSRGPADAPQAGAAPHDDRPALRTRGPEAAVALLLLALGAVAIVDSLRVGIGWADDGPRAGYFPFYIGLGLAACGALILAGQLRGWRADARVFFTRGEAAGVVAMLWPMVLFIALLPWLGLYVASALLVVYFMKRHGGFSLAAAAATALAADATIYLTFERWFMVPLPKGPLEAMLGL